MSRYQTDSPHPVKAVLGVLLVASSVVVLVGSLFGSFFAALGSEDIVGRVIRIDRESARRVVVSLKTQTALVSLGSSDEGWGRVYRGSCVLVRVYPYSPWDIRRPTTYERGRLLDTVTCTRGQ